MAIMEKDEKRLAGVKIGVVMTGSHCIIDEVIKEIRNLKVEGAEIYPIFSYAVDQVDNRFYLADALKETLAGITDKPIIKTIPEAEPIGPQKLLDIVVVLPATGNTIAKLANGITDTPALMAIKAHLRNQRPVLIAVSSNDALSMNAKNIGLLLNAKNIYFVPFQQDDPINKGNSLVACLHLLVDSIISSLQGKQLQPLMLGPSA